MTIFFLISIYIDIFASKGQKTDLAIFTSFFFAKKYYLKMPESLVSFETLVHAIAGATVSKYVYFFN